MNRTEKVTEQDTGNAFVTRKQTLSSYAFNPREQNQSIRMLFMADVTIITCAAALKKVKIDNFSSLQKCVISVEETPPSSVSLACT